MAKKEKKAKPEIKIEKPKEEKHKYFPRLLFLFGLVLIAAAVNDFFKWVPFRKSELVLEILLVLAGLWMLKISVEKGFYKKRKEIFKKYI